MLRFFEARWLSETGIEVSVPGFSLRVNWSHGATGTGSTVPNPNTHYPPDYPSWTVVPVPPSRYGKISWYNFTSNFSTSPGCTSLKK
jgi:hypothetical protein